MGCGPDQAPGAQVEALRDLRRDRGIPRQLQTRIARRGEACEDDEPGDDDAASRADVRFVSRNRHVLFPFQGTPRTFDDVEAMVELLERDLGVQVLRDGQGTPAGYRYVTVSLGTSYYADDLTQTLYRVRDPVAAYLGDIDGRLTIGGQDLCLGGQCVPGVPASYLEPVSVPVVAGLDECSDDGLLCTYDTTFYNKSWTPFPVPFQYARHGGNVFIHRQDVPPAELATLLESVRICAPSDRGASCYVGFRGVRVCTCRVPIPSTAGPVRLAVRVQLQSNTGFFNVPFMTVFDLNEGRPVEAVNVNSLELAAGGALFGVGPGVTEGGSFIEYQASGACSGHGTRRDGQVVSNTTENATLVGPGSCPPPQRP